MPRSRERRFFQPFGHRVSLYGVRPQTCEKADARDTSRYLEGGIGSARGAQQIYEAEASDANRFMNPARSPVSSSSCPAVVLSKILQVSALHFYIKALWRVAGTGRAVMQSASFGVEHHPPSRSVEAITPVNIFAIHKKLFVQTAILTKCFPPGHPQPSV